MTSRLCNFSAGPAALPERVLAQVQRDLVSYPGAGMSVLEMSHRSQAFGEIVEEAEANLWELLGVPQGYHVLLLQGGASLQFSMAPMSFLRGAAKPAEYLVTGTWGAKAVKEARREGEVRVVWNGDDDGYVRTPAAAEYATDPDAPYCHFTSNETIQGVRWPAEPATGAPLVCDMSSDFLSSPLNVERYALIYAGAQKNAGPAGVTIVLARSGFLDEIAAGPGELPTMLDYRVHAESRSLYNTPPTFSIYVLMLVTRWLRDEVGGLTEMAERNERKAALLYDAIDSSDGFYRGHADAGSRSTMNVTWRLPSEELENRFVTEAAEHGLVELEGHRSVGGIRASIYNAMPVEGVEALRELMDGFRTANG